MQINSPRNNRCATLDRARQNWFSVYWIVKRYHIAYLRFDCASLLIKSYFERLFEFEWEEEGVGAYSSWALIRGWALIRINTVVI